MRLILCLSILLECLLVALCLPTQAATVNAATCSTTDVQAAVNAAAIGDTVVLPACTVTWTSTVTINKTLAVTGQGVGVTTLQRGTGPAGFESANLFMINGITNFELRNMTLNGTQDTNPNQTDWVDTAVACINCVDFRFHHLRVEYFAVGIFIRGNPTVQRGVVDHNVFHNIYWIDPGSGAYGYGVYVVGSGTYPTLALGTSQNVFVEDNTYTATRHNIAGHNGARYVFRYNTIQSQQPFAESIDMHGFDGSWPAGGRQYEVYNNSSSCGGLCSNMFSGFGTWGGDGVVFNNTFNNTTQPIYLSSNSNGSSAECSGAYPLPQQPREVYVWGNTPNTVVISSPCTSHIVLNRDYFTSPRPGYTAYTYPHPAAVAVPGCPR